MIQTISSWFSRGKHLSPQLPQLRICHAYSILAWPFPHTPSARHVSTTKTGCRSATFANTGFTEVLEKPKAPVITMILKLGRRAVENSAEVVSHLQQRFPRANYQIMQGDKIAQMTLKDQVQLCKQFARHTYKHGCSMKVAKFSSTAVVSMHATF